MQRKVIFFVIVLISILGCTRFLVTQPRENVVRYHVCFQGGDCANMLISGDSSRLRVLVYGTMGYKVFEGYLTNDSLQIVYIYDAVMYQNFKDFFTVRNLSLVCNIFDGLMFGFPHSEFFNADGESPQLSACVSFLCFTLTFDRYSVRSNRIFLNEGQLRYGTMVVSIQRY
ncbi:MAG: hypothetical protein ACP5PZ_09815 [Bacteroidales bacterium]